ncbi:MAG: hypothetical protein RBU21_12935 [FCB group bacterium]|jgi:hypothetical protein|nr:hypothetical protein [FCB group bacterium]
MRRNTILSMVIASTAIAIGLTAPWWASAGLAWQARPFKASLDEYCKPYPFKASLTAEANASKILIVDVLHKKVHPLWRDLPEHARADTPEEVGTVIQIAEVLRQVNDFMDLNHVYTTDIHAQYVDYDRKTATRHLVVEGMNPYLHKELLKDPENGKPKRHVLRKFLWESNKGDGEATEETIQVTKYYAGMGDVPSIMSDVGSVADPLDLSFWFEVGDAALQTFDKRKQRIETWPPGTRFRSNETLALVDPSDPDFGAATKALPVSGPESPYVRMQVETEQGLQYQLARKTDLDGQCRITAVQGPLHRATWELEEESVAEREARRDAAAPKYLEGIRHNMTFDEVDAIFTESERPYPMSYIRYQPKMWDRYQWRMKRGVFEGDFDENGILWMATAEKMAGADALAKQPAFKIPAWINANLERTKQEVRTAGVGFDALTGEFRGWLYDEEGEGVGEVAGRYLAGDGQTTIVPGDTRPYRFALQGSYQYEAEDGSLQNVPFAWQEY